MKIIYNSFIPFEGFVCINLFGVLFARKGAKIGARTITHESIHTLQMKELLYIGFYLLYMLEWLWRELFTKDRFSHQAYRNISFEREAYQHEYFAIYLQQRKRFAWLKYLKQ